MGILRNLLRHFSLMTVGRDIDYLGIKVPVDRKIMSKGFIFDLYRKLYERDEFDLVQSLLEVQDRVLEIGGGIGLISAISAKTASNGSVVTVEANPKLIPVIRRLHSINNINAEVLNNAVVADRVYSSVPFYIRDTLPISSMSSHPTDWKSIVYLQTVTLSCLVERFYPTVVIIDVEGAEIDYVKHNWTNGVRLALTETHPEIIGSQGVEKILCFFRDCGFRVSKRKNIVIAEK